MIGRWPLGVLLRRRMRDGAGADMPAGRVSSLDLERSLTVWELHAARGARLRPLLSAMAQITQVRKSRTKNEAHLTQRHTV